MYVFNWYVLCTDMSDCIRTPTCLNLRDIPTSPKWCNLGGAVIAVSFDVQLPNSKLVEVGRVWNKA